MVVSAGVSFVWLEVTGRCQLECVHCYASSGPSGTDGSMTVVDWRRVIEESAGLGVGMVQFIGGEPTLHPDLLELVDCALAAGVQVEVFSNLVHVTSAMWESFARSGVRLACSYYSDDAGQHAAVTGRVGSHARTRENIVEAVRRSIPLRVGVIDLDGGQRVDQAVAELGALGVTEVGYDRLRQVGRGVRDQAPSMDQLCGHCARDVLAVAADGAVWPCVFSRWLPVGNVKVASLPEIVAGAAVREVREQLAAHFTAGGEALVAADCNPECNPCHPRCQPGCHPNCNPACQPTCSPNCSPTCQPIECKPRACWPPFSHADEETAVAPGR
ncbi:MAG: radical SAM protein [Pseudonocardiaceae bacterium]